MFNYLWLTGPLGPVIHRLCSIRDYKTMAHSIENLRKTSTEKLIEEHDKLAQSTQVGINYYLEELSRREHDKQTRSMLNYTKAIFILTLVVTLATIVNVVIAYCD